MQFIWNEDQQRQLRILKGNFVFIQNSEPFGRTSFHMKRITFKWSAGSQANKGRDEKNGKVSSHDHSFKCSDSLAVIYLFFFYYLKTPQTTAADCISFSFISPLGKNQEAHFRRNLYRILSFMSFMSRTWLQSQSWKIPILLLHNLCLLSVIIFDLHFFF